MFSSKVQKSSWNTSSPVQKKSGHFTQTPGWTDPYQKKKNVQAKRLDETPIQTTDEWLKEALRMGNPSGQNDNKVHPLKDTPESVPEPSLTQAFQISQLQLPSLPSIIPQSVLRRFGGRVSEKLLWRTFWKVVGKQFGIRGGAAVVLSAADGPFPAGELISLGIGIVTLWDLFQGWDQLWNQTADEVTKESSGQTNPNTSNNTQDKPQPGREPKPVPIKPEEDDDKQEYLYAFGNTSRPREPRKNKDIPVDENDYVVPQPEVGEKWPKGASTFGNPKFAPLKGHYHRIPRHTPMPPGLSVMADGKEVGGSHAKTHHTIFPVQRMLFMVFTNLFLGLPWQYAGNKK